MCIEGYTVMGRCAYVCIGKGNVMIMEYYFAFQQTNNYS